MLKTLLHKLSYIQSWCGWIWKTKVFLLIIYLAAVAMIRCLEHLHAFKFLSAVWHCPVFPQFPHTYGSPGLTPWNTDSVPKAPPRVIKVKSKPSKPWLLPGVNPLKNFYFRSINLGHVFLSLKNYVSKICNLNY